MEDWKEVSLQDCCDELSDGLHKAPKFVFDGEYIFVNAKNLSNGRIIDNDKSKHTTFEEFQKYKIDLNNRTLLYSIDGTIGNLARYNNEKCVLGKGACYLKIKEGISVDFIYYQLQSPHFKKYINFYTTGSTIGHISLKTMRNYCFCIPPLPTQQKIAQILSSLDDKIELNNKINANLEQQAQALFKNWFVDFEPFGGEMPAEWKVGKLSEIAEITTDTFSPDKNPNIDVEHYSLPAFDETKLPEFQKSEELKSNKFHITKDTVLVSKLNPTVKRVWRPYCLTEKSISSTEFIVFKPRNSNQRDFLFSIVNSQEFNDFMCSHVTGSTNSHQRTPPKTTLEYEIPLNCDEEIKKFCNLVTPMYDNIERNILENKKLSNLRDTLLPKLMNGEIEV